MKRKLNRITILRLTKGLSQKEMADKLSISQTYYGKLERNPKNVSLEMAMKIKNILEVNHIDDLIEEAV
ncbi:helix-turn-helix domain-containing protein [Paenibacillus sp. MER 78]|uniref:helix-turn-helix domain-containing protein n=1 Tax=Paenibacillus sp. MER 78 TaxID=2939571 RepID=UPI00203DB235|nr:helix-turn-helix transcriptional regulator [Paenibacillus sp. MER 78]MCM3130933.1 helix-turn-helix domain-containing protein [Paenibacillus sp. MER 78]